MKNLGVKDLFTFGVMVASIIAWGARLESKLLHHESLPYHASVPNVVERRINEKVELARAKDAASFAMILNEMRHLREQVTQLRDDIADLRKGTKRNRSSRR